MATWNAQKFFAQVGAGGVGEVFGLVAEFRQVHFFAKMLADLHAIAMQGGHDDVGRLVFAELHDEVGEIGFIWRDAGGFECGVETNLVGSHGFNLDDFGGFVGADEICDDDGWLRRRRWPSGRRRRRGCRLLRTAPSRNRDGGEHAP